MVVNKNTEIKIYSIVIAAILICLVYNWENNLFDYQRTSPIIFVSYLTIIISICTAFFFKRKVVQIQIPDILVIGYFFFATTKNNTDFNINHFSEIVLLSLYMCIRIYHKLNYKMLYATILFCCFILALYGYLQYTNILPISNNEYSITGPFYNSAPYGALICFFISTIAATTIINPQKIYIHTSIFVIVFSTPALIFSASRAAWLSCSIVIVFIIIDKFKHTIKRSSIFSKTIYILTLLIFFIIFTLLLYNIRPNSVKGRLLIWKVSSKMILEAPLTGFGYNGFEANYMNYQGEYLKHEKKNEDAKYLAGNVVSAYNEPIRIIIEYGVIGFILYLLFVYFILFRTQECNIVSKVAKMVILSYILFGLFSYPNRIFSLQIIEVLALSCLLNEQKNSIYKLRFRIPQWINTKVFFLLLSLSLLPNTILFHYSYRQFQLLLEKPSMNIAAKLKSLNHFMSGDYLFLQNYCVLGKNIIETDILLDKLNKAIQLSPSNTLYRMKGDCLCWTTQYNKAEQAYWTAHHMVPSNQQAKARLVALYLKLNKVSEAKNLAISILKKKIKSHGINTYILRKEMEEIISNY